MSQDSADKKPEKTGSLERTEGGRFAAGNGGGPGRPRGQTLSAQWRRDVDWEQKRTRLEEIAADPKAKHSDAIAAIVVLLDRAWGKPASSLDVSVTNGAQAVDGRFATLPLEDRREVLELIRMKLRALPEATDGEGEAG